MVPKVEVMKSKPETKCERVPREFCRKEACDPKEGRDECYFRNQVVSDLRQSTETRFNLSTWLGEISSCSCLTVLTGPAWVLLNKICKE